MDETDFVAHPYWPLFDIRVRTPRLELRPPTDEDLMALVDLVRRGIHEPTMMPFSNPWTDTPSPWLERQALQWNWRQRADWTKEGWALGFAVVLREPEPTIVGVQDVFAKNFHLTGVAESGSWLGMEHQGKGIGKEMRAAILHFGFAGLGARWLETFAWEDNAA
ncbi:MAG TPA: GNAT family N-acetyltransferase, partial [Acidimicrobiales bacterium]